MCMYIFTLASVNLTFLLESPMSRPGYKVPYCGQHKCAAHLPVWLNYPFLNTFIRLVGETAQTRLARDHPTGLFLNSFWSACPTTSVQGSASEHRLQFRCEASTRWSTGSFCCESDCLCKIMQMRQPMFEIKLAA